MKEKIAKLINVKSIVTLLLTVIFCYLSARSKINSQEFLTIFTVVIGFYFGTQSVKNTEKSSDSEEK